MLTLFQLYCAFGGTRKDPAKLQEYTPAPDSKPDYESGIQRAHDKARVRAIIDGVNALMEEGVLVKFNVDHHRIERLITHAYNLAPDAFVQQVEEAQFEDDIAHEPSQDLEATYDKYFNARDIILNRIESYSHYGIFTFIDKYYANWVSEEHGRDAAEVQRSMISLLFPMTDDEAIWDQYQDYVWEKQPEAIWAVLPPALFLGEGPVAKPEWPLDNNMDPAGNGIDSRRDRYHHGHFGKFPQRPARSKDSYAWTG